VKIVRACNKEAVFGRGGKKKGDHMAEGGKRKKKD